MVEIIITIIGIIIAILQFRMDKIEHDKEAERKKENKRKEEIMKKITEQTDSVDQLDSLIDKTKQFFEFTPENQKNFFSCIQEICVLYKKSKGNIEKLYIELIRNESEFSLSYGYERYIDAFRNYLMLQKNVDDLVNDIMVMKVLADKNAVNNTVENEKAYFECRQQAIKIVMYMEKELVNTSFLIKEIKLKYSNI